MFTTNTNSSFLPSYFEVVVENAGIVAANHNVNPDQACYIYYDASSNAFFLWSDPWPGGTWVNPGGSTPGTGTPRQVNNSHCTLDVSRSWVQEVHVAGGYQMTLQLALTFTNWSGAKEVFVDTGDSNGNALYWTNRGSWTVPNNSRVPVTTDHYDVFRTGANVHETALTPANAGSLSVKNTIPIDSCAWAHPLYVPGVIVNGGGPPHDALYVATANATLYAFDVNNNYASAWPNWPNGHSLGTAAGNNDTDIFDCTQGASSTGPSGIVGTPVIDLATNRMYVDANLQVGSSVQHQIFAIDITTGNLVAGVGPTVVQDPQGQFQASNALQRPGLLLADYNVIVTYASYADVIRPYQGWAFSFDRNLKLQDSWNYHQNMPQQGGSSIWMSGGGPAFDGTSVYFATGNNTDSVPGDPCPIITYPDPQHPNPPGNSNSLFQVNPYGYGSLGLGQPYRFQPPQWPNWVDCDADLASSRAMVIPGTDYVVQTGKSANIYVLDRTAPISGPAAPTACSPMPCTGTPSTGGSLRFTFNAAGHSIDTGSIGTGTNHELLPGLAYWNNRIYTWVGFDFIRSFTPTGGAFTPGQLQSDDEGAPISISSNFDAHGLVWAVKPNHDPHNFVQGQLVVYDALDLSTPLSSTSLDPSNPFNLGGDAVMKFTPPLVANGKVYVITASKHILVYGL